MARALDQSAKNSYTLVEFEVNGTFYRFTNWATSIDPAGDNWLATPSMEVKWPNNTGTLNDQNATIRVPENANATMQSLVNLLLADGTPAPEVKVRILEAITSLTAGVEASELTPYRGYVQRAVKNSGGRGKLVEFKLITAKSLLEVNLGLPCGHHCIWQLFGRGCSVQGGGGARGPQLADERRDNIGVASIGGNAILLDDDPGLTGSRSLQFGYAERNGVRIGIQNWDPTEPLIVVLRQRPPASWVGALISLIPGCKKTTESCEADWDNLANFGGIGYAIPAYNPSFEDSP